MQQLEILSVLCPYCGETITLQIDPGDQGDPYIEDCQVCCRPMVVHVSVDESGNLQVQARHEDDA